MLAYNMVFTLRPAAHLPCLATRAGLGTISGSSGIVRFAQGGVVKTFRSTPLAIMRSTIFTVKDTFDIEDRGVVVLGHVPYAWFIDPAFNLAANDALVFVLSDGSELPATVRGVDWMRAPIGTPYGENPESMGLTVLVAGIESKDQIPIGCTLYRAAAGA